MDPFLILDTYKVSVFISDLSENAVGTVRMENGIVEVLVSFSANRYERRLSIAKRLGVIVGASLSNKSDFRYTDYGRIYSEDGQWAYDFVLEFLMPAFAVDAGGVTEKVLKKRRKALK